MHRFLPPLVVAMSVAALASPAAAHTDSEFVAVPAGEEVTVHLEPTHGCGDAPTVEVTTRVPVAGATAGAVEGWTATATDDGEGNTVLEWSGGLLPADEDGAFPVTFLAPDAAGELLTFPFVQVCDNGEELAWIDGDPASEFPAPRLLILPAGSEPAATIDDVPPDAPGREQLTEVVDVDNPVAEPSTTTTPSTVAESTTSTEPTPADDVVEDTTEDDDSFPWPVALAAIVVVGAIAAVALRRRRA